MDISNKDYSVLVKNKSPNSNVANNCIWAFCVGGAICALGEFFYHFYMYSGFIISDARLLSSITLVGLSAFFTALGWYGRLAKRAGAGTLVPITGFANAVVSPAMEFKAEGFITGVGTKMFAIAGPVIVYGACADMLYGLYLYFIRPMMR